MSHLSLTLLICYQAIPFVPSSSSTPPHVCPAVGRPKCWREGSRQILANHIHIKPLAFAGLQVCENLWTCESHEPLLRTNTKTQEKLKKNKNKIVVIMILTTPRTIWLVKSISSTCITMLATDKRLPAHSSFWRVSSRPSAFTSGKPDLKTPDRWKPQLLHAIAIAMREQWKASTNMWRCGRRCGLSRSAFIQHYSPIHE